MISAVTKNMPCVADHRHLRGYRTGVPPGVPSGHRHVPRGPHGLGRAKIHRAGGHCIAPLSASTRRFDSRVIAQDKKLRHWQQIAISACEQCGRNRVPRILAPQDLADWVTTVQAQMWCCIRAADSTGQGHRARQHRPAGWPRGRPGSEKLKRRRWRASPL